MRILGIDPGLNVTGYGLLETLGQRLHYQASGTIRIPKGSLPERLKTLFEGVRDVAQHARADIAVVEFVFVNVNPQSTLLLGQARGAAIAALVAQGLPVVEYTALQLKKSVVGYGRASKEQMQAMVMRLLALPGQPGPGCGRCAGPGHLPRPRPSRADRAAGRQPGQRQGCQRLGCGRNPECGTAAWPARAPWQAGGLTAAASQHCCVGCEFVAPYAWHIPSQRRDMPHGDTARPNFAYAESAFHMHRTTAVASLPHLGQMT